MVDIKCSCSLVGRNFNPDLISNLWTNLSSPIKSHKKGDPSIFGRYKGGYYPDSALTVFSEINEVLAFLEKVNEIQNLNIESIFLDLIVKYKNQCNFEINPDILMKISKLNLTLSITCYEED